MSQSVIAASASILCKIAEHYKIDPSPIFQQAGLDIGLMRRDPNARYDSADIDKAWSLLAIQIDHPCFALKAADCWHPSDLHALGYAWLSSTSLRSALERLCRYTRIITDMDDFTLHESEESVTVIVENRGLPENVLWAADASMAMLVSMCRVNHGQDFNPLSVEFMHPEPPCASEYYATFRCPLVFNADANCLQLSSQVIDEPLAGANAVLALVNDHVMIDYLAQLDKNDVVQLVRSAIIKQLPSGNITDTVIAVSLNRTERTLQRQLKKEGTTFKTLLNEMRIELAAKYIRDNQLSLTEISFLLGFSESSSFSRAFRRWTGASPTHYREKSSAIQPDV